MDAYVHINNEPCTHIDGIEHNDILDGIDPLLDTVRDTPLTTPNCFNTISVEVGCMQVRQNHKQFVVEPAIKIWLNHNSIRGQHPCGTSNCAATLAAGKCCDKYMRETVGAILYPHLYHKTR